MVSGIVYVNENGIIGKNEYEGYASLCNRLEELEIKNVFHLTITTDVRHGFDQIMELQKFADIIFVIYGTEHRKTLLQQIEDMTREEKRGFEVESCSSVRPSYHNIWIRTVEQKQIFFLLDEPSVITNFLEDELPIWKEKYDSNPIECNKLLEEQVVQKLLERRYTVTAAESCTGGLFLGRLINVSGSSSVIKEGYVTYSEEAKMKLVGVSEKTLTQFGVVSEEVARELASGSAAHAKADIGIGITGIAGPTGGSKEKPVGTVCIAVFFPNKIVSERFVFPGSRKTVRELSVSNALQLILDHLV